MNTKVERHYMSNLQLELLKLYSTEIPEKQLLEIKRLLWIINLWIVPLRLMQDL